MKIIRQSMLTAVVREREINVTQAQLDAWRLGVPIQVAMPQLSDDDREFIMTGITAEEWDAFLADDESSELDDNEPAF